MFFEPINLSAVHIYHSALELSPLSSIVRRLYYHRRRVPFPRLVAGTLDSWDQSINISGGRVSEYRSFAWSPCGQLIAASYRGVMEIRDPRSSELLSTLKPTEPTSWFIGPLAYSPDGHSLAAFSNVSLIVWDIQTGGVVKEAKCGATDKVPLAWSLDGRTIGTILLDRDFNPIYTVCVYDVASGATRFPGTLRSIDKPHLWAHNRSFRIMTTGWDGEAWIIDISEVGSVLAKIESFRIGLLGGDDRIESFSPSTYRISALVRDQLRILDIQNSECLLVQEGDHFSSHCFSSDGSLFAASPPESLRIWKYTSGHYTLWREFPHRKFSPFLLRFSPNLSSIAGSFPDALEVWPLDRSPTVADSDDHTQLAVLSHRGTYTATCRQWDTFITTTSLHSQVPPQFIDAHMKIHTLALTGNILLVFGSEVIVAWRLTEEGGVVGLFPGRRAGRVDSIWAVPRPDHAMFSIEDQIVVVKYGEYIIHTYHSGTGEVVECAQMTPRRPGPSYSPWDMCFGRHYPHYNRLGEWGTPSGGDWPVSQTIPREGWVKDPEGKHRLWVPVEWRTPPPSPGWFSDITTLWLNLGRTVIIML